MKHKSNPAKDVMGQIFGACYNQNISFSEVVNRAGYSSGTAHNDRTNPLNLPLKRLIQYMQILDRDEINLYSVNIKNVNQMNWRKNYEEN